MRQQRWILLREDGSVASQLIIAGGDTPAQAGDNPDRLVEIRVRRHGDLVHEHWDPAKSRWVSDRERKRKAERRAHLRGLDRDALADLIAAEIRAELGAEIEALRARVAALEGKVRRI